MCLWPLLFFVFVLGLYGPRRTAMHIQIDSKREPGSSKRELNHFSHKNHRLIFEEHNNVGTDLSCYGCEQPIWGPTYWCIWCNFYLHQSCARRASPRATDTPNSLSSHTHLMAKSFATVLPVAKNARGFSTVATNVALISTLYAFRQWIWFTIRSSMRATTTSWSTCRGRPCSFVWLVGPNIEVPHTFVPRAGSGSTRYVLRYRAL